MSIKHLPILAALGLATTATAGSGRSPTGPDFTDSTPARTVATDTAASSGDNALQPLAVMLFKFDSSAIATADQPEIAAAQRWIGNHPHDYLVIEGYTDTIGTYAYNAGLATRRAETVRERLIALGADPAQLVVGVFGEAHATSPSNAANRRVVLRGTTESLATIKSRTLVDGMAVVWSYDPHDAVARRIRQRIHEMFRG